MTIDELKEKAKKSLDDFDKKANDMIGRLKRINEKMEDNVELAKEINDRLKPNTEENKSVYEVMEEWRAKWQDATIKNAMKENKVYDIDRLFWNDGKLFGYDTTQSRIGPWSIAKIEKGGHDYTIKFKFDWGRCELTLACDDFNAIIAEPIRAQVRIGFDMLFGVNPGVVKIMIKTEVERLIKEIERLKNDGKKDNRDC